MQVGERIECVVGIKVRIDSLSDAVDIRFLALIRDRNRIKVQIAAMATKINADRCELLRF